MHSQEAGGGLPPLKWDIGLFEQVVRGYQFLPEWDARYPSQGKTAADAPTGYITLFADFFSEGDFRLPTTHFLANILQYYGFHISQMSPIGMVRVRHFEFVCRSQGEEPTIEKFRVFYQLQGNMGFFSFALRNAKKILISPPKSFHDWKMKFFYICVEVIPMAMQFRAMGPIAKEHMAISRGTTWYENLMVLPNLVFGEQVLVAAGMSDRWPEDIESVFVLLFDGQARLYQSAFPTFAGVIGTRPLRDGEEFWLEQIRPNFMFTWIEAFAAPPLAAEGARIPKPRPCRAITFASKEIVYLSGEELVASSEHELNPSPNLFAGVLRYLGVDPDEKKTRRVSKKKTATAGGATVKKIVVENHKALGVQVALVRKALIPVRPQLLKRPGMIQILKS
ncbi:hypothetical protein Hanom_Chr05g00433621 [Helianthus anomalus]